jgi:hypothetical protein
MNTGLRQPIQVLGALRPVNVRNPDDAAGARARDLCGNRVVFHQALPSEFQCGVGLGPPPTERPGVINV